MKKIPLSSRKYPGFVALVDDEDYETVLAAANPRWRVNLDPKNRRQGMYAVTGQWRNGTFTYLHWIICGCYSDHIDHNGLNNQKINLRLADAKSNLANRPKQRTTSRRSCSSGFKGVRKIARKTDVIWEANISDNRSLNQDGTRNGRLKYLGRFESEEAAARAYDKAAKELHGEFACLNFP